MNVVRKRSERTFRTALFVLSWLRGGTLVLCSTASHPTKAGKWHLVLGILQDVPTIFGNLALLSEKGAPLAGTYPKKLRGSPRY